MAEADVFDLFLDAGDDDFQKVLPAGAFQTRGKLARDELRTDGQHEHQCPGEHDCAVEFEKPVLPEDHLVGTKAHSRPPVPGRFGFLRRAGQPRHHQARDEKSKRDKAATAPSVRRRNEVKSGQGDAHPQQQAAEEPKRRPLRRNALAHRPPKTAEEKRPQQHARRRCQRQQQNLIHRHPPVRPASLCLLWLPNATR